MRWKVMLAGVVVLAAAAAGVVLYGRYARKPAALRLPGVVEIQEVRLGSRTGGRVVEVLVREGDTVKAGQVLVRLDDRDLKAQREQVTARLREAQAQLSKAQNGPRQEEKDVADAAVKVAAARLATLQAGFRKEEIQQAESDLATAEADLKLGREDYQRAARAARSSAAARSELDAARAAFERGQGRTAAARARVRMLKKGTRDEEIREAKAEVSRTRANLALASAQTRSEDLAAAEARVAEAQGKLREIEVNLEEATVRAPENAVVEVVAVRAGDLVSPGQAIVRVLRTDDLWVKIYVPETDLGCVRLHQRVEVAVDCYDDRRFVGEVVQISSESEFTPRNVQSVDERRHQVFGVKVRVADAQGVFKSGMAAEVWVPLHD